MLVSINKVLLALCHPQFYMYATKGELDDSDMDHMPLRAKIILIWTFTGNIGRPLL